MNFHETKYGHIFYEGQLPRLIKARERIADDLSKSSSSMTGGVTVDPNFLHDLYFGEYEPSVFTEQSVEQRALDRRVSAAEQALQQIFAGIPAAAAAFEAYQLAVSERNGATVEQAFESGYRTAVNMLAAGLILPGSKQDAEIPLTTQELRKMDGEQVFCLDMNEDVRVVARKKGFIQITNDKEIHRIVGLTLYRHRPSWCQ